MSSSLVPLTAMIYLLTPQQAFAAEKLLQRVDLVDMGMSTEGREANLYRLFNAKAGRCKIDVVHFGETGRMTYRFVFDTKLQMAVMREYAYAKPIYVDPNASVILKREVNLSSKEGASSLPGEFLTSQGYFDAAILAQCSRTKGR